MTAFLLDTNVVSEMMRHSPDERVERFLGRADKMAISVVSLHELAFGIERLPVGRRRDQLQIRADKLIQTFADDALPVRRAEAALAATFRAEAAARGRALHLADAFVAATALTGGFTLATRNTQDFAGVGIDLIDPFLV